MALGLVVGLQYDHIRAVLAEIEIAVVAIAAEPEIRTEVARGSIGRDRVEPFDAPQRNRRALAGRTVPDLQRERRRGRRVDPEIPRLQPEIVRVRELHADERQRSE